MCVPAQPDVYFYYNPSFGTCQWNQPPEWLVRLFALFPILSTPPSFMFCAYVCPCVRVSVCLCVCVSVCFRLRLRLCLCLCLCLCVCQAADRLEVKSADEIRRLGFSTEQWNATMYLQSMWRGRCSRIYFRKMKEAIAMMKGAEAAYMANPKVRESACTQGRHRHLR